MAELQGRHAVITGGGTGIGMAIARALAGAGAKVTLMARDLDRLQGVCTNLPDAQAQSVDVTSEKSVARAMAAAHRNGAVSILINNAGDAETEPLATTTMALWRRMLEVNLTGTFLCCRALLPVIARSPHGRIVNIASTAGLKGYAYAAAYTAAKHGVVGMTRSLALELATTGATANAVCPGFTDTGMLQRSLDTIVSRTGMTREQALERLIDENPQHRLIAPDEVAAAVLWLCNASSAAINGQSIAVAGGEVM